MKNIKSVLNCSVLLLMIAIVSGCGGGGSSTGTTSSGATSYSYATTSSKGDYSEWTLTGDQLVATWNVVSASGAIDYTYDLSSTCGSADSYGIHSCTVDTSSCTDGASSCPGSFTGSFDMMDIPGVALFVQTGSGTGRQLHIGFAKDDGACADDVSGDYTMIRTGLGLAENFGIYRSDADFLNIEHAEFGFNTADANMTQSVAYRTGTASAQTLTDNGCVGGVRSRGVGGETVRSMMTASGLFVLDLPAGQGGILSFKVDKAASLSDFANKTFGGISFPDDGPPQFLDGVFGPVTGNKVNFAATTSGSSSSTLAINALATPAAALNPPYPGFGVAPAGYASTTLAADYATPAVIPGMFKIDDPVDEGRVIIAAMKFGGKVVGIGMVYNYRTTGDTDPSTGVGFAADGLYNTGNFILFER